ncbi:signal peptidase I [Sphingomonas sp. MM-1]|uniref:signal peptidase I n=1 Tax=Sphingomonas sp. MM-1 TaxID=745310 RepID=UPI0002C1585B|nr:signal peptidase I [Sphingomonas sp. MM-1]AGH47976.1 signal peptidase I [Sphingomonas sp. MM-1]
MENIRFLLTLLILAVLLRSLVVAPFNIPSESMLPRLLVGDYLFVAKWPYGYSRYSFPFGLAPIDGRIPSGAPDRGDVVVFKTPSDNSTDYIKRVIGLPGDIIQIRGGQIILNGTPVPRVRVADFIDPVTPNSPCRPEPGLNIVEETAADGNRICRYQRYRETLPNGRSYDVLDLGNVPFADDTPTYVVPQGHYFLMGDNRDRSADSRYPAQVDGAIGMVPSENIVGRALVMFFSTDGSAEWLKPWTWPGAVRWSRLGGGF